MAAGTGVTLRQEIRGLRELQRESERIVRELHGDEMLRGMRRATLLVQTDAKKLAPVDTGRLRSSITPDIRTESRKVIGVVGSNVIYAPYQETGTRRGMKAHPYLQPAFEQNKDRIQEMIGETVGGIINR